MKKLKKYESKRDLKKSPEPKARIFKRKKGELKFVIQKHAASRLHYDFRIEVDGVLKSWAVPKGPSLDPSVKHLAIQVEDHPYEYRNFEGVIPRGYGAGTVMIWDQGTYDVDGESPPESEKLIREGLKKGDLHFTLKGEKLKGRFSLVKLKKERNEWLLIKSKDAFVTKEEVTKKERSVVSNKTLDEIAGKAEKPHYVKPMLATLIDEPFDDPEWIFEIKWDGFRALAEINKKQVSLYSRNLKSFNTQFPTLVQHLKELKIDAILDGEIVVLDEKGVSHFQLLQNYKSGTDVYFYVFDILYLNGKDLRDLPLIQRKRLLKKALKSDPYVRYLDHVEGKGKKFFALCKKQKLEGIIGKNKESLYASGVRSREWVKIKVDQREEVVICGFTEPRKSRKELGALIVGVYKKGKLHYAGHVGGGFTEKLLKEVKAKLSPHAIKKSPFQNPPKTNTPVTWIEPLYRCEVKFKEWTSEGNMRMPIFMGFKEDAADFITHREKLYWEKEKITKGDLIAYYEAIAPFILPYLVDRPQTLKRYPNGIGKGNFFQKNITSYPDWLETFSVEHHTKTVNYTLIQDLRSLLYVVNLGCIEIHPWLSTIHHLENPEFLLLDLDPEAISFDAVVKTALKLREILEAIGIESFCKTSGGRGLHICIPLQGRYTYEQSKRFAELIALLAHEQLPEITSLERSPKNRQKKVYIDCYQNNFGQTIAAPYSVRAKPGAPVSTPLLWSEVKLDLDPDKFTLFNTLKRLEKKGDLFKPLLQKRVDLNKALKRLEKLGWIGSF